jgi:hypothetical protein
MSRLVVLVLLQAACADQDIAYPAPPELVLGFGYDQLVPIENGDAVPIAMGLQGGTVLWGAISARYLDPHGLELVFTVSPPDGAPALRRTVADLDNAEDGFATSVTLGQQVFLPDADRFAGMPCVWRVDARDREGRTASDSKTVVPVR